MAWCPSRNSRTRRNQQRPRSGRYDEGPPRDPCRPMNEADASTFVVKGLKPPRLMPVIAGKTDSSRARSRASIRRPPWWPLSAGPTRPCPPGRRRSGPRQGSGPVRQALCPTRSPGSGGRLPWRRRGPASLSGRSAVSHPSIRARTGTSTFQASDGGGGGRSCEIPPRERRAPEARLQQLSRVEERCLREQRSALGGPVRPRGCGHRPCPPGAAEQGVSRPAQPSRVP